MKSKYGEGPKFSFVIKTHLQAVQKISKPQISEASLVQECQIFDDLCERLEKHPTLQVNNSKVFQNKLNIYEEIYTLTNVSSHHDFNHKKSS